MPAIILPSLFGAVLPFPAFYDALISSIRRMGSSALARNGSGKTISGLRWSRAS